MITINLVEKQRNSKTKAITEKRSTHLFNSTDKARKFLAPVVAEMKTAKTMKREPTKYVNGVSFDTRSEKSLLIEMGAIELQEESYD